MECYRNLEERASSSSESGPALLPEGNTNWVLREKQRRPSEKRKDILQNHLKNVSIRKDRGEEEPCHMEGA